MTSSIKKPFLGVSNEAFGKMIAEGLHDAARVTAAGLALPPAKRTYPMLQEQDSPGMLSVPNQALGAYIKQALEIRKIAQALTPRRS